MSCETFIVESFALGTAAHLIHLSSKSNSDHLALGTFYEDLIELIDEYAEVYQGLTHHVDRWPDTRLPKGRPIELLEDYLLLIEAEVKDDNQFESLKSILAEIEALTARTLYKLRNLK